VQRALKETSVATRREPHCEFCGAPLEDMMLAFMEHMDQSEVCRENWNQWRQNVRREAGGT
jgi:hypothetical protein